jgi:hypothetical protein
MTADVVQYDDDLVNPHNRYGWRDLEGPITVPSAGANRPTLTAYLDDIEDYAFAANDHYGPLKFHIPHDYARGTDLFIHAHWSHNGTNISGALVANYNFVYAKGHNQANFGPNQKTLVQTVANLSIANTPALRHRIDEIQLSTKGGGATLMDTDAIEVDGLILVHFDVTTIPAITGGAAKPFIHYVDIHYQSDRFATRRRAPDFYSE